MSSTKEKKSDKEQEKEVVTKTAPNVENSDDKKSEYYVLGNNFGEYSKYEEFFENIGTNSAFQVLVSAVNFAQKKGAYNMEECSLIDKSIKTIVKESEKANSATKTK